ncbi:MAG TPA: superoxide dismutase family protein [Xanthomonadaceae bacterium]|nr:superoxide dismutase family protein [Xanthomonadaceae bacterium]
MPLRARHHRILLAAPLVALSWAACAGGPATAELVDAAGKPVGSATLKQTPHGVLITATAEGLTAGEHAFHIHETGQCDPGTGFSSAGGHFALGREHGFLVEAGPHPGDMPNVVVGADGRFAIEVLNGRVSLEPGADGDLFDADGSALVIHAGADDYHSQPAGAAGDRVACGVIRAPDRTL